MDNKFFLQSKTFLGVILILIVNLAPFIGLSFGEQDAALVNEAVDTIATALGALIAMWGRVTASTSITLNPFKG